MRYVYAFADHGLYRKAGEAHKQDLCFQAAEMRLSGVPLEDCINMALEGFCGYDDEELNLNVFEVESVVRKAYSNLPVLKEHSDEILQGSKTVNVLPISKQAIMACVDLKGHNSHQALYERL